MYVAEVNGQIVTTILVDIEGLVVSGDAKDVIGESGYPNAYITKITQAVNGIPFKAEMSCLEVPAGSNTTSDLDLAANTAELAESAAYDSGTSLLLINGLISHTPGTYRPSSVTGFTADLHNYYLYLANGSGANSGGTYTSGKFMIRLFATALF